MNFLKKALDGGDQSTEDKKPSDHSSSNADLVSNAKMVAEAAQAQFENKPSGHDKGEVAGAAANLLDAAEKYGKLDEKQGVGKYVEQAEGYLRGISQSSHSSTTAPPKVGDAGEAAAEHQEKPEGVVKQAEDHEAPAGGAGDFMKMAGNFLNK